MAEFENSTISELNPHANITSHPTIQVNFFKMFVSGFNLLFGPPTHLYVLWLIVTGRRIVSEFLYLNLSVSEVIISVISLSFLLEIKFQQLSAWLNFAVGLITTGRPLFQCLICVERYLAVVHPVTFLKYKPLRYKVICCTAVWIISLGSCVFTMFTIVPHDKMYMYCFLVQFFLFLFINLFCCLAVLWALKQPGPGERGREREREMENHVKRRAFYLILITTVTMVIMLVPTIIVGCFYVFSKYDVSNFTSGSFLCFILSAFVQPVLYLHRSEKMPFLCCSYCSLK